MKQFICLLCTSWLFFACSSNMSKTNHNNMVIQLNDSAVAISTLGDTANIMAAIKLLNEAIDIQSDYYIAYWNKVTFQCQLGLMDDAFATLKVMEQISPENPDLKTMLGTIYEKYKKDMIQAIGKYTEADLLYKSILDTINANSLAYQPLITSYAFNLKMLGETSEANRILYSLIQNYYSEDKEDSEVFRQFIETNFIKKTREELLGNVTD